MKMNVKDKIKAIRWKRWIQRPFSPFVTSLFVDGIKQEYFEKIEVANVYCKAELYQYGFWYESDEVWEEMDKKLKRYLKNHSVSDITKTLDNFYNQKKQRIKEIINEEGEPKKQLAEIYQILTTITTFIWLAHGLDHFYTQKLKEEVPKYVKEDVDKFIGDASFPEKKNAHALMEELIRKGEDPQKIAEEFGWLRSRDGFSEPFSAEDIKKIGQELSPPQHPVKVKIPNELKQLFKEIKELVFFRTARTDVFYEFIFLARPILDKVGELYDLQFQELKYYTVQGLITGKPKKYNLDHTFACYQGEAYFSNEPLIEEEIEEVKEIKGNIAHKGVVRGTAKVVRLVSELDKVKKGDILITQMTFPSFISAMARAAAFVTDEGGITCHAAIVAREMKKPCIIGTKNATQMLKDGDKIEVNANKGIVRKLK